MKRSIQIPRRLIVLAFCATFGLTLRAASGNVPTLMSPAANAALKNGSPGSELEFVWNFKWDPVPDATHYSLVVMRVGSRIPAVNVQQEGTEYRHAVRGYIADKNRKGWQWKVRAKVGGEWQDWSEVRKFEVKPLTP